MRVLFIGPFPWPSHQGSQAYLAGQATALARRGHQVHLLVYGAGTGGELPGVTLHRARRFPGGEFTAGGLHRSRPLHDLALAARIRRLARQVRPDLLHAHNVEGPLAARLANTGLPIIYDLHTRMSEELADHLPGPLRRLGPVLGSAADRLALACSTAGCAISDAALEVFSAASIPAIQVGPGIDPAELRARPGATERFAKGPAVLYTGNLDRYQNLDRLFAALEHSGVGLRVVTGSSAPLPDWVDAVRSTDFRDAIDALSTARLAVIPRARCAGFPVKLLNQLGMGVPTVMLSSAAVALPGVVPTAPDALRSTIEALLADPDRLHRLGVAARAEVLSRWTWDASMERLEGLYRSVGADRASGV